MKKLLCLMLAMMLAFSSFNMALADGDVTEVISETPVVTEDAVSAEQAEPVQSSEPVAEPVQESVPEPASEPEQASEAEPVAEIEQASEAEPVVEIEQVSEAEAVAEIEQVSEAEAASEPEQESEPVLAAEPEQESATEPATVPEQESEPAVDAVQETSTAAEAVPENDEGTEENSAEEEIIVEADLLLGPGLEGIPGPGVVPTLKVENAKPDSLKLTWTSPSTGADGYEMTLSKNADFSSPVIRETTNTYYNITGLICGVTYYYRVRAYKLDGPEKVFGVYKSINYRTSPAAPSSLTATQVGASQVKLTWSSVSDADGYVVTWGNTVVATIAPNTTVTFTHNGVDLSLEYKYRVYSYKNVDGNRVQSDEYAEADVIKMVVPAPQNLTATSAGTNSVKLTWDKVDSASYYIIQRDADGSYVDLANVTTNSYTDTNLIFGKDYKYVVTAYVTADIHSDPCDPVVGNAVGEAPTNLKATMANSSSIDLSWDKTAYANGYRLESSPDKSTWTTAYEGAANSYSDSGLSAGDKRYYRVAAYVNTSSGKIYSDNSTVVYCVAGPGAPEVSIENTDYNKQKVTWTDLGSTIKYEFQLSTNASFSSPLVRTVSVNYYNVTGCANATEYYYRVRGYLEISSTESVYGPWSAIVSKTSAPSAPAVSAAVSGNTATVTWGTVNGATSYLVYVKKDEGAWSQVGKTTAPTTTYTVKNLEVGCSYIFGVYAVRTASGRDAVSALGQSAEVFLDVANFIPSGFSDTPESDTSMKVTWKNPEGGVSQYDVKVTSSDDTAFNLETTATSNSLTVTGMKKGCEYQVTVRSKVVVKDGTEQYSAWSSPYTIVLKSVGPATLSLTSAYAAFAVSVDWTPVTGADGYIIQRATAPEGPYSTVQDLGDGSAKHHGDYSLSSSDVGKAFYYRICSYNVVQGNKATSAWTGPVKVILNMPRPTVTAEPQNKGRINLTWTDLSATKYEVYRSTSAYSGYMLLTTVTTNSYSNAGLSFGTIYYYRVRAIKLDGGNTFTGAMSLPVSAEPKTVAPTITTCTAHGSSVTVNWSAAAGASGYNVYYHLDGEGWKLAGSTNKLTYTVTGLTPESLYFFRVAGTAVGQGRTVVGLYSAETSVTTVATSVGQVTGLTGTPVNLTSCSLTWTKVADATGYEVQFATYYPTDPSTPGPWHDKATVTTNSATIGGLHQSKRYHFRVRAYVTEGGVKSYGPWSADYVCYSAPVAPTNVRAVSSTTSNVTIAWDAAAGAAGYRIWYKKSTDANFTILMNLVGADITQYTITGLSSKTGYNFKVQSFGQFDTKLYGGTSGAISVTTK